MHSIPESKKSHLWRKIVWHTDPDEHPLGPYHHAEVYCCEEANGYAVWYVRKLARDDTRGIAGMENADYLIAYFPKTGRDNAIERAVLLANSSTAPETIIQNLDRAAAAGQKV
jgi:hypothetical protein